MRVAKLLSQKLKRVKEFPFLKNLPDPVKGGYMKQLPRRRRVACDCNESMHGEEASYRMRNIMANAVVGEEYQSRLKVIKQLRTHCGEYFEALQDCADSLNVRFVVYTAGSAKDTLAGLTLD